MTQNERIFCWHHSGLGRLKKLLAQGLIDCPHVNFLANHGLVPGNLIRVSLKVRNKPRGGVVAVVRLISSRPFKLTPPLHKSYPYAVRVDVIQRCSGSFCHKYPPRTPPMSRSHWVCNMGGEGQLS
jgi:hypothetical protein